MKILHLNKSYFYQTPIAHALKDVSIDFIHSGIGFIMGESGSGKSTILNMITGIEPIDLDSIKKDRLCTYIFSTYDLTHGLTVLENIQLSPPKII